MTKTLKTIAIATVSIAATAVAATMLLPRDVTVTRTATIAAAPAAILAIAASNEGYQRFNPYKATESALTIELMGPASGVGSAFRFTTPDMTGTQTVSAVSDSRVDYALDLGFMGRPNQSIEARPGAGGSTVTWTMTADLGFNPIARVMGLFMDDMQGPVFETGLKNLGDAVRS